MTVVKADLGSGSVNSARVLWRGALAEIPADWLADPDIGGAYLVRFAVRDSSDTQIDLYLSTDAAGSGLDDGPPLAAAVRENLVAELVPQGADGAPLASGRLKFRGLVDETEPYRGNATELVTGTPADTVAAMMAASADAAALTLTWPPPSTNAALSALSAKAGEEELIAGFDAAVTSLSVSAAHGTESVTVTAAAADTGATIEILPGAVVPLTAGEDMVVTVRVTAEDGVTVRDYVLTVTLAAAPPEESLPADMRPRAEGAAAAPAPAKAGARWRRAARALSPARALISAVEITHPDAAQPVRAVNDTQDHVIDGKVHAALRFDLRLADDVDGRPPRAELAIDNVGRAVTRWVEAARGGSGAAVRLMQISVDPAAPEGAEVEWQVTLAVHAMRVNRSRVVAVLGPPSLRGRAAVISRYDPAHAPGLF